MQSSQQQEQNDFYYPDLVIGIEDYNEHEHWPLLRVKYAQGKYFVCFNQAGTLRLKYASPKAVSKFIHDYVHHCLEDEDDVMVLMGLKNGADLWDEEGLVFKALYGEEDLTLKKVERFVNLMPLTFIEEDDM